MAKYKVCEVEEGWMRNFNYYIVEADSQEEAEQNYQNGEFYDSEHDESYESFGVDSEYTELIEEEDE